MSAIETENEIRKPETVAAQPKSGANQLKETKSNEEGGPGQEGQ